MNPVGGWPWSVLGLQGPADAKEVRRAYASKLKEIDQTVDIQGFTALRSAYDFALRVSKAGEPVEQPVLPSELVLAPSPQPEPDLIVKVALSESEPVLIAPEPAPELEALREFSKWERFNELKASLRDQTPWTSAKDTVMRLLTDPLAQDDEVGPMIRRTIRDQIVEQVSKNGGEWPVTLGKADVLALDRAYHWLSDYRVAQADFGGRDNILRMMAQLAFGQNLENAEANAHTERRQRAMKRGRFLSPLVAFFCYVLGIALLIWAFGAQLAKALPDWGGGIMTLVVIAGYFGFIRWFTPRILPYVTEAMQKEVDYMHRLRRIGQRFALSPGRRSLATLAWVFGLLITMGSLSYVGTLLSPAVVLSLLALGITHELIQVWLNSGRR